MRFYKRFNTILFKLSASYVIIIVFSVFLTGALAGVGLKRYSDKQIISTNEIILSDMRDFIDKDILIKSDQVYQRLVMENMESSLFAKMVVKDEITDYKEMNNFKKLLSEQQVLNSEWMSNMVVYFVEPDLVISSGGILYQKGESENRRPEWLRDMLYGSPGFAYYPTKSYGASDYMGIENIFMLIRQYPINASDGEVKAYIIFGVKESAVRKILHKTASEPEQNALLIIDEQGNVISASENFPEYDEMQDPSYWRKFSEEAAKLNSESGNIKRKVGNVKYVFSYHNIDKYKWKMVNIVPEKQMFKGTQYLLLIMVLVCLLAITLGVFISNFFTRSIYAPVQSIVNSALKTIGSKLDAEIDERATINRAIERMEDYKNTLNANWLLIKDNMVQGLINDKIHSREEINRVLRFYGNTFDGNQFTAVLFTINHSLLDKLTVENRRFILFKVIEIIEGMSSSSSTFFAAEQDPYSVVMIAAYNGNADRAVVEDAQYVNDLMFSDYYMSLTAVIGHMVDSPEKLYVSWDRINSAMQYRIFMSDMSVIMSDDILKRQDSKAVIPDKYFENLTTALNTGKTEKLRKAVHDIVLEMVNGSYSAAHCNTKILDMMSVISKFLHGHNIRNEDIEIREFDSIFYSGENIYEVEEWIIRVIDTAFKIMGSRQENPAKQAVERAKEYIMNNLAEELSLSFVAKKVYISPSYLSKVFREETGINFSGYVNKARMEKASDLLINTNMNVDDIAKAVGYNTTHYFIKKFRESYGTTPKNYRIERMR